MPHIYELFIFVTNKNWSVEEICFSKYKIAFYSWQMDINSFLNQQKTIRLQDM